ncbi:hypothetical protein [Phytohabitans rumicis]|uniref:Uncharacterized protein n=1 Tax=Phytohabitans rumicis TaxID=1076125 RepID=A0A6V8KZM7_9ACTN|nr:hypothetical protein [Phytohabitans rumicis]GFJ87779.1 hypothetical protein Prum_014210 [Phytohabitans rumicis]
MATMSRRGVLGTGALAGAAALATSVAGRADAATGGARVSEETKSLEELYAAARREDGELVIYAGGDTPTSRTAPNRRSWPSSRTSS